MKRLFIKRIKEFNAYKQYRRNFSLCRGEILTYGKKEIPRYEILHTILNKNYSPHEMFKYLISFSFIWRYTNEGEDFWFRIYSRI